MRWKLLLLVGIVAGAGCREADRPSGPVLGGLVAVDSDPQGARIYVDGELRSQVTPDTLRDVPVGNDREITVLLDSLNVPYGFAAFVNVPPEGVVDVFGPLLVRCASNACFQSLVRYHTANSISIASSPTGHLFYVNGQGNGLYWPETTQNSYVSTGGAIFAGQWSATSQRVALGPYAFRNQVGIFDYLSGRPAPDVEQAGLNLSLRQSAWVLPPAALGLGTTVRGLEIEQEVIGRADVDGALLVRLTFRNITNNRAYRRMDPQPVEGVTYTSAYIGFVLDVDIGQADDDLVSYDPDLGLVFAYDSNLRENEFQAGWTDRPGLVGVRVLEAPAGVTPLLTAWPRAADWHAGTGTSAEESGWAWMAGQQDSNFPDHPDPRVGYTPTSADDYRIAVTAGPLRLAPDETASLTVAVVIAEPEPGTFTSGQAVAPGNPMDPTRQILQVAAGLRQRAIAAEALLGGAPAARD